MPGPMGAKPPQQKPKPEPSTVYLYEEFWRELERLTEFHQHVFTALGSKAVVSRNDMIDAFLRWAVDEYWASIDGPPGSEKDRDLKAAKKAEQIRALEKQQSRK